MTIFSYTRPSTLDAPGHFFTGLDLETLLDFIDVINGAWKSDADTIPTWTAGAGTPAVNTGTLAGRLQALGKTRHFELRLDWGADTTGGTAGQRWEMTIPGGGTAAGSYAGSAWLFDTSAGSNYPLMWKIDSGQTTMRFWRVDASPAVELLNNFITMATGDVLFASGMIEIV